MTSLFPQAQTIEKITPDGNAWCWIHVAGRKTVRLHTRTVVDLDLKAESPWTAELAAAANDASKVDHAVSGIRKWLHARPRTQTEAAERLAASELPAPLVERALNRLVASGEIDDAEVADLERRAAERKGESQDAWHSRVQERGLDPAAAPHEAMSAVSIATKRAESFPIALPWALRARRLLAWLASRGFSEDEATAAVRTVLGSPPEPETEPQFDTSLDDAPDSDAEPEADESGTLES